MIRIGLIGTQSIHAAGFARCCNFPDAEGNYPFPNARVTAVYGVDDTPEHIRQTMTEGNIPTKCDSLDALCQACDAFMLLQRRGGAHMEYAEKLIARDLPVFIDKPVCRSRAHILALRRLAAAHNAVICGGSAFAYHPQILQLKRDIQEIAPLHSGCIRYSADINSPYDGIFFYLPHAVQIMLELFGDDPRRVRTEVESHGRFTVHVGYDGFDAALVMDGSPTPVIRAGGIRPLHLRLDERDIFSPALAHFIHAIETGKVCHDTRHLTRHVEVILAVEETIRTGKEICFPMEWEDTVK